MPSNPSNVSSNAAQQPFPPASSDYPKSLSLKIEEDDLTSSDEQTADPFNPDSATSDNEDILGSQDLKHSTAGDHSRDSVGSTPHPAPSVDGSATTPSEAPLAISQDNGQSIASSTESDSEDDAVSSRSRTPGRPPADKQSTSPPSRANKDKKPPPPPRSHHGKRISVATDPITAPSTNKSNHRLSFHSSSPESLASVRPAGTPNASTQPPVPDYFSMPSDNQGRGASSETVSRDSSQHRRPPTPPLSRRKSQMQRSKSTQSRSNMSRLTLSSVDSESNDGSQPPSPGLSTRSGASTLSRDRKRVSMPPPASTVTSAAASNHLSPPIDPQPPQPGRRASSYGNPTPGSSSAVPPPPPPPRRARDPNSRSEGRPSSMMITPQEEPLPQPSNAHDILADLSRLQKEVDDLRGHYESRKVSQ